MISSTAECWLHNAVVMDAGLGARLVHILDAVFVFFALVPLTKYNFHALFSFGFAGG